MVAWLFEISMVEFYIDPIVLQTATPTQVAVVTECNDCCCNSQFILCSNVVWLWLVFKHSLCFLTSTCGLYLGIPCGYIYTCMLYPVFTNIPAPVACIKALCMCVYSYLHSGSPYGVACIQVATIPVFTYIYSCLWLVLNQLLIMCLSIPMVTHQAGHRYLGD